MWTDGSILANYTNWGKDNPNDLTGYQNCGHMLKGSFQLGIYYFSGYNDGEWNDFDCDYLFGYICEKCKLHVGGVCLHCRIFFKRCFL